MRPRVYDFYVIYFQYFLLTLPLLSKTSGTFCSLQYVPIYALGFMSAIIVCSFSRYTLFLQHAQLYTITTCITVYDTQFSVIVMYMYNSQLFVHIQTIFSLQHSKPVLTMYIQLSPSEHIHVTFLSVQRHSLFVT